MGDYMTYAYPNWAVKFCRCTMIQENAMNEPDTDK